MQRNALKEVLASFDHIDDNTDINNRVSRQIHLLKNEFNSGYSYIPVQHLRTLPLNNQSLLKIIPTLSRKYLNFKPIGKIL